MRVGHLTLLIVFSSSVHTSPATVTTIPSWRPSVPTMPACSRSSLPPLGTQGIKALCSKYACLTDHSPIVSQSDIGVRRHTSPKDGWYPLTQRGSAMPTSKCMHVGGSDIVILAIVIAVLACRKNFA
ncbi:hypothetical protein EDB89DRAFT_1554511 [Lactarius sanguifluus]|nr:hypothetical protein EDB89DRAFT_1554511 [Lactarius sanguifluus]